MLYIVREVQIVQLMFKEKYFLFYKQNDLICSQYVPPQKLRHKHIQRWIYKE